MSHINTDTDIDTDTDADTNTDTDTEMDIDTDFDTLTNYQIPQGSLKLQKALVIKNTTSKNIGDSVVYNKGLSFVGNATRVAGKDSRMTVSQYAELIF